MVPVPAPKPAAPASPDDRLLRVLRGRHPDRPEQEIREQAACIAARIAEDDVKREAEVYARALAEQEEELRRPAA